MEEIDKLYEEAVSLLKELIAVPSFSREENQSAGILTRFLAEKKMVHNRSGNNVWALNRYFDPHRPTVLLNSHHDTVKPNPAYTRDPFIPEEKDGKLFGLGSNDAGAPAVSLLAAFRSFYDRKDLRYNLAIALTAEEEISGKNGIESLLPELPGEIAFALVGEPTSLDMAVAEKGLLVLDCTAKGKSGHAAREEGVNAIYKAMKDMEWFRDFEFEKVSATLGKIKMTVTIINGGKQHNVVPAECKFTVDVRVTDAYALEEVLEIIRQNVDCEVVPRSVRLRPSSIDPGHPIVRAAQSMKIKTYGSPTMSDQALIPFPSVKIGPGDSARSHSADEFVYLEEIRKGIALYIELLEKVLAEG